MSASNPEPPRQTPGPAGIVDTHCHLFLLEGDPAFAVEVSRAAGVETLVCVGIDPGSSRRSLELAESFRGVFATAGMHPHEASEFDARAGAEIEELLGNPLVVGVGECGLDFFRMRSPREDQERVLRTHVGLARESGLPLVVHVRDAWPDILRVLDEGSAEQVVLHCFSGDADIARACTDRGWYLSFAGNVTYPKNAHLRDAAGAAPLDRILVETDSPFLAPQRLRGRDNVPANVVDAIEEIAAARGEPVENVRTATAENARRAFPRLR
ncbi:MAG TPA: TatD family hydrolase [Actinomycetota bacterium]|nr:TatD family hydrolase [Actinomycetota bacterium]